MAYNNKIIKKVLGDFENKYKAASAAAEKRRKELHGKIPGFSDIEKELAGTYRELSRIMLGPKEEFDLKIGGIKKQNTELQKKRKSLIKEAGYPANYAEPAYECKTCEDTGYKGGVVCDCLKKALAAESINHSGLGRVIKNQTFENFKLEHYKNQKKSSYRYMGSIRDDCKTFVLNFGGKYSGDVKRHLMFMGPPGLGKTHLSSAIAVEVIKKGFDVYYDSAQSILYSFEKERFSRSGTFDSEILERYMTCDLLIIDDLGTEYSGNMSVSSLYNLINMRLLDNKSMIISTNLTGDEIKMKYDERIVSRIFGDFTPLQFIGEDIRIKEVGL